MNPKTFSATLMSIMLITLGISDGLKCLSFDCIAASASTCSYNHKDCSQDQFMCEKQEQNNPEKVSGGCYDENNQTVVDAAVKEKCMNGTGYATFYGLNPKAVENLTEICFCNTDLCNTLPAGYGSTTAGTKAAGTPAPSTSNEAAFIHDIRGISMFSIIVVGYIALAEKTIE